MRIADAYTHHERATTSGPTNAGGASGTSATAGTGPAGPGRADGERADKVTSSGFHVKVSPRALELAARTEAEATRTTELRTSIDAGTFKVDSADIAKKLVGSLFGEPK